MNLFILPWFIDVKISNKFIRASQKYLNAWHETWWLGSGCCVALTHYVRWCTAVPFILNDTPMHHNNTSALPYTTALGVVCGSPSKWMSHNMLIYNVMHITSCSSKRPCHQLKITTGKSTKIEVFYMLSFFFPSINKFLVMCNLPLNLLENLNSQFYGTNSPTFPVLSSSRRV